MILKDMPLDEARDMYNRLKNEKPCTIVRIVMDDIWFFTDGLTKDYCCKTEDKIV